MRTLTFTLALMRKIVSRPAVYAMMAGFNRSTIHAD